DLGAYAPGRDPLLDEAIRRAPAMESVLRQDKNAGVTLAESVAALRVALGEAA
ncbi:MAG TPA: flagellum-specific ATP synthase FliI, partial [Acidocella sp.]|nr:flagellum-specific ATP synthase FliI [Acidocella sp.]